LDVVPPGGQQIPLILYFAQGPFIFFFLLSNGGSLTQLHSGSGFFMFSSLVAVATFQFGFFREVFIPFFPPVPPSILEVPIQITHLDPSL